MAVSTITIKEVESAGKAFFMPVDIRDPLTAGHGMIEGAVCVSADELMEAGRQGTVLCLPGEETEDRPLSPRPLSPSASAAAIASVRALIPSWDGKKTLLIYCARGELSRPVAECLQGVGIPAVSLEGGYGAWLLAQFAAEKKEDGMADCQEIELSIRKKFHKQLFSRFAKAINEYDLLQPGDKVAVCISGGKDSMLMAKLFQELSRHNKFPFELVFLVMDPGYSPINRQVIESNAQRMNIPVTIFESDIFDAVYDIPKSPCYLCARMRRGHLYHKAQELGCNKIALGHHYDDVIETILMGMLYGGQVQTMMPKLHSTNFPGMELIRPMYLIREDDIKHWRDYNHLYFLQCACHFTETCATCHTDGTTASKRLEVKNLIREMKKNNPFVESNIFRSVENVNLATVIAYKKDGVVHRFTDDYEEIKGTDPEDLKD